MRKQPFTESGIFNARLIGALVVCGIGVSIGFVSFAASPGAPATMKAALGPVPTFGHPVISGIDGVGFEQDLRLDPSNPNRLYTSVPGALSSNTSFIWRSLDGGKTFKWVPGAAPLEGKVTTCAGGGDTELGVDSAGHLYFNDLTLANFSTSRSDDAGTTFTCSNTGVPDAAVDRQWYAIDGDPTNGGSIYLANDEIGPGGAMCGNSAGNNVLAMYRSPAGGGSATAGIEFGPRNAVTPVLSCDEGIMGNNEVSPVATTLGQPNGSGGFATLPSPVKHIYVIHDDASFHQIRIGRCFPVPFGVPLANVSDPSGMNCTDILVSELGTNNKTGASFATMAIDNSGNLYAVWEQAPIDSNGLVTGDTVIKYSYSTNQGNTWSAPIQIDSSGSSVGTLHTNVFAWIAAGDDGRVNIAWYGTPGAPTFPSNGPDSCPMTCDWSVWVAQSQTAHAATPTFSVPVQASEHFNHRGSIQTVIGGQTGDRTLGDYLQLRTGPLGEAQISYADSNNIDESSAPHGMYVRQNGGPGLLASNPIVDLPGLRPFNSVSDPAGDGKYERGGMVSANMPQLDILSSSISLVTTAPCSSAAPCYRVSMQLNNLTLAPSGGQDPDTDLVWQTQWLVPSKTDPKGGKNFFVYAESNNGAPLQCFSGENAVTAAGGGGELSYPGANMLPAANCQSTLGANGTITIYVPLTNVAEASPLDNRLHEVTASTMTLQGPANAVPSVGGIGGSFFNVIDPAQGYVFDPTPAQARLLNVSGRVLAQTGEKVGIGGFIVKGSGNKRVILRARGPSLGVGPQAIPGTLQDPLLELHDSSGGVIVNDNWQSSQEAEITASGFAPSDRRESAIIATLPSGNYTGIIKSADGTSSGVGIVEIFDLDPTAPAELGNLSVRADVEAEPNLLIDGIILGPGAAQRVLFRAIGPDLSKSGVTNPMQDPTLGLYDVNGTPLLSNDNYKQAPNAAEFPVNLIPGDERDSVILTTLAPGNYTTIIRGAADSTGVALSEAYQLDN